MEITNYIHMIEFVAKRTIFWKKSKHEAPPQNLTLSGRKQIVRKPKNGIIWIHSNYLGKM